MQQITIPTMASMITYVGLQMRDPLMFWGQPGAGKTEGVYQVCDEHNGVMCDVRLGQYDSVDLRGIPVPDKERNQTVWYAPITLPFKGNEYFEKIAAEGRPIFLFLDEFNQCAPAVFGVAMQLTNERRVGEHELLDSVVIVCAGNRESDRAVVNRMPSSVANRLVHAEIALDVDAWCYWAQQAKLPSEGIAFMQFRKDLLSTFENAIEQGKKAYASPRSWEKALRYYASNMPEDIKQAAMSGSIGEGPAAEFWGFVEVYKNIPSLAKIEKDPTGTQVPEEPALAYATAVSVSGAMDNKNIAALNTYLMRFDPEFVVLAWQLAIRRDRALSTTKEFLDVAKKHSTIFAMAS